ncbi:MAG: hypothetical protein G01um101448_482 [Parcubacteria group bacterium Gr01-1014_48]|nr:MAG: hypothetical protein Greene041614_690 [Parcubacteria group bacterium Greene0416_14]TSC73873.1 MAG: hypothetical protein G01um101448_482 [Parcubacteria group bacterium Gr01-1014_48]TSD01570.1 MAG: hypothetical protein Greene101415_150 [Parcubacteria group bacterium Greene1014_15]TSD08130.1 MAG: hypothetical protein Greene07144_365 [Parcubacteria group bacterium Greene0714_4]
MFKYLIAVLCLVFGALTLMYFYIGVPVIYDGAKDVILNVHRADNAEQSISKIYISAFYFVPKNKKEDIFTGWSTTLQEKLEALMRFHTVELQEKSELTYTIYPEPIIGRLNNIEYDTFITQHGNPEALRHVVPEIESRVFEANGDLFRNDFGTIPKDAYHVLVVMYEGVGSIGGDNIALISRTFLTSSEYAPVSESLLAHEFYHTLGLPDAYTLPEGTVTSQDIMGLGRYTPIGQTYLSQKSLQALGL